MGRSIQQQPATPDATFYHRLSNRHYTIANGRMRRHQLDASGRKVQEIEKTIDFGIGSGNHAVTYVSRSPAGMLLQLPLTWYREPDGYRMSPGYDRPDHFDMRREISDACLFCHAAYPETPAALPRSIDCQRCHGSAEAHLRKPARGTILNPARLTPERQREVCFQCHLETVSQGIPDSFRRPGRKPFSYRPGEPLGDYKVYFDRADAPERRFEVNHAAYRMLHSECFQRSNGTMTCTTCHDPHTARARNACSTCHSSEHARRPLDCAGCHMPKRRTNDAIHVRMTDHWIARPRSLPEPTAEDHRPYELPVVPYYTPADPLSLAIANIRRPDADAVLLYRQHLRRDPADVPTLAALGNTLLRIEGPKAALAVLERARKLDPRHPGALNTLAVARGMLGDLDQALSLLDQARKAHPDHALTWLNLGVTYQTSRRREDAANALREAIRLQPDFVEARQRLAALLAQP